MASGLMYRVQQVVSGVAGSPYYLTGYFNANGGTAQAAADAWRDFVMPGTSNLRQGLLYRNISEVDRIDSLQGQIVGTEPVTVASALCTSQTDPIPPSNQILIRSRTGVYVGGREVRGRTNIGGWMESDNTAGQVAPSLVDFWNARANTLRDNTLCDWVVWSRKNGQFYSVETASTWNEWAILRSRRD